MDCGDSFSKGSGYAELEANVIIEGMNHMGYDALNVADGELSLGMQLFDQLKQKAQFPFLTANIFLDNEEKPVGQGYVIKEFNGFKVGIVGVASLDSFDRNYLERTSLIINAPEQHLRQLLPEITAKADVIILLSHLGLPATEDLLGKFDGIDVAIVGHDARPPQEPKFVGNTIVAQSVSKGSSLGILELRFDHHGLVKGHKGKSVALSKSTPVDPTVHEHVLKFRKDKTAIRRVVRAKEMKEALMEKNQKLLKMTPEEFVEQMKKDEKLTDPEEFLKMKRTEKQD